MPWAFGHEVAVVCWLDERKPGQGKGWQEMGVYGRIREKGKCGYLFGLHKEARKLDIRHLKTHVLSQRHHVEITPVDVADPTSTATPLFYHLTALPTGLTPSL